MLHQKSPIDIDAGRVPVGYMIEQSGIIGSDSSSTKKVKTRLFNQQIQFIYSRVVNYLEAGQKYLHDSCFCLIIIQFQR